MNNRTCGVLLSITSLPSNYGIGTLGAEAYKFVDFLSDINHTYWQILPIGQTSYGDSPYQTFSAYAGNPYFVDLDILIQERLLKRLDLIHYDFNFDEGKVDYAKVYHQRYKILRKAHSRFVVNADYALFCKQNEDWLDNYALFMSLKDSNNGVAWNEWAKEFKFREKNAIDKYKKEHIDDINFYKFIQFKFFEQWNALRSYANEKNVKFIGDMAIYVAYDSADVWENPSDFELDENLNPIVVAGCPPDPFAVEGQLWGNPIYNWKEMEKNNFKFWVKRTKAASEMFDVTRIDHFRGIAGYYEIPFGETTAINGSWKLGPGMKLFNAIKAQIGDVKIIAEDLGFIDEPVVKLLKESGFPGMKLIMFGFDSDPSSIHLPHNYETNYVCYAGTHDNSPINGWKKDLPEYFLTYLLEYLNCSYDDICYSMIRKMYESVADYAIVTMQDILELDETARFNIPSVLGGNWEWRLKKGQITPEIKEKLKHFAHFYNRSSK